LGEEGAELDRVPGKKCDMRNFGKENGDERPEADRGVGGLMEVMVVDDAEAEENGGVEIEEVNVLAGCLREERLGGGGIGVEDERRMLGGID
jgi:hypothetical protein